MGTTVEFDDDVARAVERLRREQGLSASEAVNRLIRQGLLPRAEAKPFEQTVRPLGLTLDASNVTEALEILDGFEAR